MARYDYHTGLTSWAAADDALEDGFASGDISAAERPQIETYYAMQRQDGRQVQRWKITLSH